MAFLEVNGYPREKYPSLKEMKTIIEELTESPDSFVQAAKQDYEIFIQCCKTNGRFTFQYNNGVKLNQCKERLSVDQITNLFIEFNSNSTNLLNKLNWEEVNLEAGSSSPLYFSRLDGIKWAIKHPVYLLLSIVILFLIFLVGYFHIIPFLK